MKYKKKIFIVKIIGKLKNDHRQHNFSPPNKNIFTLSFLFKALRALINICLIRNMITFTRIND